MVLKDEPLFTGVIPSKIFEANAMGLPIIASLPVGEATKIIEATNCGVIVPPENPVKLAEAIKKLKNQDHLRHKLSEGGIYCAQIYNREIMADKMLANLVTLDSNSS